jgi:hypothetical protein
MHIATCETQTDVAFEQYGWTVVLAARLAVEGIEGTKALQAAESIEGGDRGKEVIGLDGGELILALAHSSACPPCMGGHSMSWSSPRHTDVCMNRSTLQ